MKNRRHIPETAFAVVVRAFLNSPQFRDYAYNTQETWGRELRLAERPDMLGGWSIYEIRPAVVQMFLDGLSHKPGKATVALAALGRTRKSRWSSARHPLPYPGS